MDKNCVEDICKVLNDIVFAFEILNYKSNSYINNIVKELKSDIEDIENKYT
jgi:hypothetical protein